MPWIGRTRGVFEACVDPICGLYQDFTGNSRCEDLPEENRLGSREALLHGLGTCARLCYGTGLYDTSGEEAYHLDPPLQGEGWRVVAQICEAKATEERIQAGCYVPLNNAKVAIVAYRGTSSKKGVMQDIAIGMPVFRKAIRLAVREAFCFYEKCKADLPDYDVYVTGHSLGGFIAEAAASYCDAPGAVWNCPGPVAVGKWKQLVGPFRPNFEVHLTRNDPLAFAAFPKPESHHHIAEVKWHEGKEHKICIPYVRHISEMRYQPNNLPVDGRPVVDQIGDLEAMYPPPKDLDAWVQDSESESGSEEESSEGGCCVQ